MAFTHKKIAVLISGNGTNLQAIIDSCGQNVMNHLADCNQAITIANAKVCLVISNKADAHGLLRAELSGIDHLLIPSKVYDSKHSHEQAIMTALDNYQPDLIVLAGYMRVLSANFVKRYTGIMLNIHPSLLPKYPGLNTHQRVIDNHETIHGTTVHFVTEELDGGPIIIQAKVAIDPDDTPKSLGEKIQKQEYKIYPQAIKWFLEGRLKFKDNNAFFDGSIIPSTGIDESYREDSQILIS